jgi:tetratricopeptide (TPR) repeat protein
MKIFHKLISLKVNKLTNLGLCLFELNHMEAAIECFDEALKLDP